MSKLYKEYDKLSVYGDQVFLAQWRALGGSRRPVEEVEFNIEDHYQYMAGYPDGTFRGHKDITREEVAAMFSRLLNKRPEPGKIYPYSFVDIDNSRWSITPISYMSDLELIKGYPDNTFRPTRSITRAEFASMASRLADLDSGEANFNDLTKDHWANDSIAKAYTPGWIAGYPDGSFKPEMPISRVEVLL